MNKYKDKSWLKQKYIEEGLSQKEISDICRGSRSTVGYHIRKNNLSKSNYTKCHDCGGNFSAIGHHWGLSDCGFPEISQHQFEVMTGLLMSDGNVYVPTNAHKPVFRCTMKSLSQKFINYLSNSVLGDISISVDEYKSGGYETVGMRTVCHPKLEKFLQWYKTGEKIWNYCDIELTPTVLKYLYVGDGTYNTISSHDYLSISAANEYDRSDEVSNLFQDIGFNPSIHKGISNNSKYLNIQFSKKESRDLFEYMGEPLPSFEYKWPK